MLKKFNIKTPLIITLSVLTLLALIGFVGKRQADKTYEKLNVRINYDDGNTFVDDADIIRLVTLNGAEHIVGQKYNEVNLKEIEARVKKNAFIEQAQVYKDHKGNLIVEVEQCRPIARLIRTNDSHAYLGHQGSVIAVSEKFTPRVLVVDGPYVRLLMNEQFLNGDTGKAYLNLIQFIDNDKFWKAQIAQLTIDAYGDITMLAQVGNQVIRFGTPDDMEKKFIRLSVFYRKIVPVKGWNAYKTVNVKYKDQIICE